MDAAEFKMAMKGLIVKGKLGLPMVKENIYRNEVGTTVVRTRSTQTL